MWAVLVVALVAFPALSLGGGVAGGQVVTGVTITGIVTNPAGVPYTSQAGAAVCPGPTFVPNCADGAVIGVDGSGHYTFNLSPAAYPATYTALGWVNIGGIAGSSPVTFTFQGPGETITQNFVVSPPPPPPPRMVFTYIGATSGDLGDPVVLSVRVTNSITGNPVSGVYVMFGGIPTPPPLCEAYSDASGVASCTATFTGHAGLTTFGTSYGPGPWFLVTPEETVLTYAPPATVVDGASVQLSGQLHSDDGVAVAGAGISLGIGSQSCIATTDASGTGTCGVTVSQPPGPTNATATFAGNGDYQPTTANATTTVLKPAATGDDCKDGGWQYMVDSNRRPFKNQGDCVSFVATGGKNLAAG
jgi:hypothetical protein